MNKSLMFSTNYMGMLIWDKYLIDHCINTFPEFKDLSRMKGKLTDNELPKERVTEPKIQIETVIDIDPKRHIWGEKGRQKKWCIPTLLLDLEKELGYMPDPKQLRKPSIKNYNVEKYESLNPQVKDQIKEILKNQSTEKDFYLYIHYLAQNQGELTDEVRQLFLGEPLPDPVDCPEPGFHNKKLRPVDSQMLTETTPILAFLQIYKNTNKLVNTSSLKGRLDNETDLEVPMEL